MAVKSKKVKATKAEVKIEEVATAIAEVKAEKSESRTGRWASVGWVLLLVGGLAHMLPEQMAPVVGWSVWGVTLQMAVGVLSVILALNFLLED